MATANTLYSNFIDAADVSGNIKNDKTILLSLSTLANTVVRLGDTKFTAVYPVVGGTADSHKINFMNPDDTDAAGRLTFNGSITHNSLGMKGDGIAAYANTHIIASSCMTQSSGHLSFYPTDNANSPNGGAMEIGVGNSTGVGTGYLYLSTRRAGTNNYLASMYDLGASLIFTAGGSIARYSIISRIASNLYFYQKEIIVSESSVTITSQPPGVAPIYILASSSQTNPGLGMEYPSLLRCGFASIGQGLTKSETQYLFHQVKFIQGILGRQ